MLSSGALGARRRVGSGRRDLRRRRRRWVAAVVALLEEFVEDDLDQLDEVLQVFTAL